MVAYFQMNVSLSQHLYQYIVCGRFCETAFFLVILVFYGTIGT